MIIGQLIRSSKAKFLSVTNKSNRNEVAKLRIACIEMTYNKYIAFSLLTAIGCQPTAPNKDIPLVTNSEPLAASAVETPAKESAWCINDYKGIQPNFKKHTIFFVTCPSEGAVALVFKNDGLVEAHFSNYRGTLLFTGTWKVRKARVHFTFDSHSGPGHPDFLFLRPDGTPFDPKLTVEGPKSFSFPEDVQYMEIWGIAGERVPLRSQP